MYIQLYNPNRLPEPAMSRAVPISELRNAIFDLFDEVVERAGEKVVISRRNRPEQAVLVSAEYVAELEAQLRTLRATVRRLSEQLPAAPFELIGSATLLVPEHDVLERSRARQADLAERKRTTY